MKGLLTTMNTTSVTARPQLTLSRLFGLVAAVCIGVTFLSLAESLSRVTAVGRITATALEVSSLACFSICAVRLADLFIRPAQGSLWASLGILTAAFIVVAITRLAARACWSRVGFALPSVTCWALSPMPAGLIAAGFVITIGMPWVLPFRLIPTANAYMAKLGVAITAWHVGALLAPAMTILKNGPPYLPV